MKLKSTLLLLGIALGLFIFVYTVEFKKPKDSETQSKNLGKKMMIQHDRIVKISLDYADAEYENIICSKDADGNWQIEKPINAKADQKEMDRIIYSVIGKNIQRILKDQESVIEYGLDNPKITAIFHLEDGEAKTLLVGNMVPTGNYVYIQQESKSEILLVPASIADDLTKKIDELQEKLSDES